MPSPKAIFRKPPKATKKKPKPEVVEEVVEDPVITGDDLEADMFSNIEANSLLEEAPMAPASPLPVTPKQPASVGYTLEELKPGANPTGDRNLRMVPDDDVFWERFDSTNTLSTYLGNRSIDSLRHVVEPDVITGEVPALGVNLPVRDTLDQLLLARNEGFFVPPEEMDELRFLYRTNTKKEFWKKADETLPYDITLSLRAWENAKESGRLLETDLVIKGEISKDGAALVLSPKEFDRLENLMIGLYFDDTFAFLPVAFDVGRGYKVGIDELPRYVQWGGDVSQRQAMWKIRNLPDNPVADKMEGLSFREDPVFINYLTDSKIPEGDRGEFIYWLFNDWTRFAVSEAGGDLVVAVAANQGGSVRSNLQQILRKGTPTSPTPEMLEAGGIERNLAAFEVQQKFLRHMADEGAGYDTKTDFWPGYTVLTFENIFGPAFAGDYTPIRMVRVDRDYIPTSDGIPIQLTKPLETGMHFAFSNEQAYHFLPKHRKDNPRSFATDHFDQFQMLDESIAKAKAHIAGWSPEAKRVLGSTIEDHMNKILDDVFKDVTPGDMNGSLARRKFSSYRPQEVWWHQLKPLLREKLEGVVAPEELTRVLVESGLDELVIAALASPVSAITTARPKVQNPLRLIDGTAWHPDNVARQLEDIDTFAPYRDKLAQIQQKGTDEMKDDPVYDWATKELHKILEAEGYDAIMYTNMIEAKGQTSVIIWDKDKLEWEVELIMPERFDAKKLYGVAFAGLLGVGSYADPTNTAEAATRPPSDVTPQAEQGRLLHASELALPILRNSELKDAKGNPHSAYFTGQRAVNEVARRLGRDLTHKEKVLLRHEGFVARRYYDSKGNITGGMGQTGRYINLPIDAVIADKEYSLRRRIPSYLDHPVSVQAQLLQLHYRGDTINNKTGESYKWVKMFNDGKYAATAKELLDSDDYRKSLKDKSGVAPRMEEAAKVISAYKKSPKKSPAAPQRKRRFE